MFTDSKTTWTKTMGVNGSTRSMKEDIKNKRTRDAADTPGERRWGRLLGAFSVEALMELRR
jgi:hypothetical protein